MTGWIQKHNHEIRNKSPKLVSTTIHRKCGHIDENKTPKNELTLNKLVV
jgi:hypothetical protein